MPETETYEQISTLNPTSFKVEKTLTNTETDETKSRYSRALGQKAVEDSMEELFESGVARRLYLIRTSIFGGLPDVRGYRPESIRDDDVFSSEMRFPKHELVKEHLLPPFEQTLDSLYYDISQLPPGRHREKAAERLAAVSYVLGFLIHPYIDGNGQSFRLLAESYLKEFNPKYEDKFFKFKLSGGGNLQEVADVDVNDFAHVFKHYEREILEHSLIEHIDQLIPKGVEKIPLSLDGLKAYFLIQKLDPDIHSFKEAYKYYKNKKEYIDKKITTNPLYMFDNTKKILKKISDIKNSYKGITVGEEGKKKLRIESRDHERIFVDIENLMAELEPEEKVYFNNAIELIEQQEKKFEKYMADLEEEQKDNLQVYLFSDLYLILDPNASSLRDYVIGKSSGLPGRTEALFRGLFKSFIKDINKRGTKQVMETGEEHTRNYENIKARYNHM